MTRLLAVALMVAMTGCALFTSPKDQDRTNVVIDPTKGAAFLRYSGPKDVILKADAVCLSVDPTTGKATFIATNLTLNATVSTNAQNGYAEIVRQTGIANVNSINAVGSQVQGAIQAGGNAAGQLGHAAVTGK